jgi:P pilus assembly chaperone PapD
LLYLKQILFKEKKMRKILSVLVLLAAVSGFLMAQNVAPVTKENCTIEYDSAKKVVRLTNKNADPYTIQYTIDGKGKSVVVDKQAVWEQDASKAAPKAVDIVKVTKAAKAGPVDKDWKVVPAAAAAGTATPAPAPAPAAGGKTTPAPAPAKKP